MPYAFLDVSQLFRYAKGLRQKNRNPVPSFSVYNPTRSFNIPPIAIRHNPIFGQEPFVSAHETVWIWYIFNKHIRETRISISFSHKTDIKSSGILNIICIRQNKWLDLHLLQYWLCATQHSLVRTKRSLKQVKEWKKSQLFPK